MRPDGRAADQMRPVKLTPDFVPVAEGSVLIEIGQTRVICTATLDDGVPSFLKGSGKGWVTAEYGMLPRATEQRTPRESTRGKQSGRTLEIARLIGRSLARDHRPEKARRAHRVVRLRCDSSGRRHAHRVDHRRVCGHGPGFRAHGRRGHHEVRAAARFRSGDQRRPGEWRCPRSIFVTRKIPPPKWT